MDRSKIWYDETKKALEDQESFLVKLAETLDRRNIKISENDTWRFERAKMIGMLEIARKMSINVDVFGWIYNV